MSNGHSPYFSDDSIVSSSAVLLTGGVLPHTSRRLAGGSGSAADTAQTAGLATRLGVERGDLKGLLPDLAGIAVLVTALGAYGGFW